ncbi:MAG TPA: glycoside hydrolase family 38 C-terminal domain-containing protein [Myxococcota bacterium]|nr:glycoside hydrolase family 38 C-terminal domain-containing protein [Myxococcota bacterium]
MSRWQLVLVPHTHWDREWYRSHEAFRYRLVRMLDDLLALLERDPGFLHFTLDGQTIAVDDYLEVRPAARARIEALVRARRLQVGPWFVLPDEWLVSGEALIRNLRRGLAEAERLGGAMPVGYVPDQFGHVGQLPQLLAGFGLTSAVLWRGVGADVDRTLFSWESPDGTRLDTAWLLHGYGNGMHLPRAPEALAARLMGELRAQAPRSPVRAILVMNGSDHLVPQPELVASLAAARPLLEDADVEIGTLAGYFERVRKELPGCGVELPVHRGELRSGLRAPILAGCASARLRQKRADFLNDRLLTRYLEPLAAWWASLGGDPDLESIDLAWRTALENHPHDSICGCSIDAVHDAMGTRFGRVADWAGAHLARVCAALAREVEAPPGAGHAVAAFNPHGAGAAVAEGTIELPLDLRDAGAALALAARGANGVETPAHGVVEAPAQLYASYDLPASAAAGLLRGFPREFFGDPVCALGCVERDGRACLDIWLGDSPPAEFDFDAAREAALAWLGARGDAPARFRPWRLPRVRVQLPESFPEAGLRTFRVVSSADASAPSLRAGSSPSGAWLENAAWRIDVSSDGRVRLAHRATGLAAADALRLVSEADRGDAYTFDPLPQAERVERAEQVAISLAPSSPAYAGIRIDARYRVPASLAEGRRARSERRVDLPVHIEMGLFAGMDRVDVRAEVDNTASDHRLRLHVRLPFEASRFAVESAFELATRPIAPAPDAFGSAHPSEFPDGATPQRRFAVLEAGELACALANRGSSEVEAVPEGQGTALAVTLVRAVGWLSRDDLARRPGPAGPPLATPGAQCPGRHVAELALFVGRRGDPVLAASALRFADPPLLFAAGAASGRLRDGARLLEWDDPSLWLCALEPREGGVAWVRVLNASDAPRNVKLRWNGGGVLAPIDLRGRADPAAGASGAIRTLALRPWQIASLRAG